MCLRDEKALDSYEQFRFSNQARKAKEKKRLDVFIPNHYFNDDAGYSDFYFLIISSSAQIAARGVLKGKTSRALKRTGFFLLFTQIVLFSCAHQFKFVFREHETAQAQATG